jgi:hypothetical protein
LENVIWTDETSVVIGVVRGKRRIWRRKDEAYDPHVIVQRWKGYSEFQWWSAFSYDKKGPYHIWEDETLAEKKQCQIVLDNWNAARRANDEAMWSITEGGVARIGTRNKPGRKPQFRHTEETGAYVLKEGHGGINWWRYQQHILLPLLLPFAKQCERDRPGTLVQEDGAASHRSRYQQEVFDAWEIQRLLWPANSPDLNMIEPCWMWMKRETTKKGPCHSKQELRERWVKCWKEISQERIQAWVERIARHVKEVIRLEGGNEYQEGRLKGQEKRRVH